MPDVAKMRPGAASFAVVGKRAPELLTSALGALLGAYAVVAVTAGGVLMQRQDIT